ncbi:hypothetical protein FAIPA1_70174 [Frankia sp. AiPs1]
MAGGRWCRVPCRHRQLRSSRPPSPLPTADPPPPALPQRVTTDRPRETSVPLLRGYEGTNWTENPVEATSLLVGSATIPESHHGQ